MYTNNKIRRLIKERDQAIDHYNALIEKEVKIERSKHKFNAKNFLLLFGYFIGAYIATKINRLIFDDTSIWSFDFWFG